jgi:hypothetical protein
MIEKKVVKQTVYTLKSKQKDIYEKVINLPIIGEVLVTKDGEIEVDEYVAKLLLNGDNWEIVQGEEEKDENTQNHAGKTLNEGGNEEEEEDYENEKINKQLEALSLEEMVNLAKESNIAGYNLFKSDEKKMRTFLLKKMSTSEQK